MLESHGDVGIKSSYGKLFMANYTFVEPCHCLVASCMHVYILLHITWLARCCTSYSCRIITCSTVV